MCKCDNSPFCGCDDADDVTSEDMLACEYEELACEDPELYFDDESFEDVDVEDDAQPFTPQRFTPQQCGRALVCSVI